MLSSESQDLTLRLQETMFSLLQVYEISSEKNSLFAATEYALSHTGKMLRGRLLLEACQAVGGEKENALSAAVAVEYLHLGTLIHDDMIDRDELRRGHASVWKQYNQDVALLSGDWLYFAAYRLLARSLAASTAPAVRVLDLFSSACMDLCLGQTLEEKLVGHCSVDQTVYHEVALLKTGSLFRAALQIGALLGGGSDEQVEALGRYAEHLGLAFQMTDDLLPFTSSQKTVGKPVTSDIKNHRLTAPILYAFAAADETARHTLQAIYEDQLFDQRLSEAHTAICEIFAQTDAVHTTRRSAEYHRQQAIDELLALPDNAARDSLRTIAAGITQREK